MNITLSSVTFRYPKPRRLRELLCHPLRSPEFVQALSPTDLEIPSGSRLAICGQNGAGKTTLLKLIGALLLPSTGTILWGRRGVDGARGIVRENIGYVINEERSFYWRMTGWQNLEFFAALNNEFGRVARSRIEELMSLVGLQEARHIPVAGYSAGMKQRLALARGLLTAPKVLLLDEPTRSLDPAGATSVRELIGRAMDEGSVSTLVVTTNHMEDVSSMCSRMIVLRRGTTVTDVCVQDSNSDNLSRLVRESTT